MPFLRSEGRDGSGCGCLIGPALLFGMVFLVFVVGPVVQRLVAAVVSVIGPQPPRPFLLGFAVGAAPSLVGFASIWRRYAAGRARLTGRQTALVAVLAAFAFACLPPQNSYGSPFLLDVRAPYLTLGLFYGLGVSLVGGAAALRLAGPPVPPPDPLAQPTGRAARLRRRRPGHSSVTILDVRPGPEEPDPWIPYFAATCNCGWIGTSFVTEAEARFEASRHAPGIDPVVERPLG
ncbi:MAG: hypothetical protein QOE45_3087 [Frankiaceae bacterium]|nr:hypothetical protein [Frankiaceae bacterium]